MRNFIFTLLTLCVLSFTANAQLVISGVYDGPLSGGTPKGVELYVTADIPDLSLYGIGSANNGGGSDGVEFTFPAMAVTTGTFLYIATDSTNFFNFFGFYPNFMTGSMAINGDDAVELFLNGNVVDVFGDINTDGSGQTWEYTDGWAYRVSGMGPDTTFSAGDWSYSGTNALDNETSNATAATPFPVGTYTTTMGQVDPTISFDVTSMTVSENVGMVNVVINISNPNSNATTVDVALDPIFTDATDGVDFSFTNTTVTFPANSSASETVTITIIDDLLAEFDEDVSITMSNPTNNATITGGGFYTLTIDSDDIPNLTNALVITGAYDGPLSGGHPKGIELYVTTAIPDLSIFGIASVNNGTGSSGVEYIFPPVSATAGQCIFVAADSTGFADFFGFNADYISGSVAINGDDAVEVYELGEVIDVFGDVNVDGSGQAWDYLDGWAYRVNSTGPDGSTFVPANWYFSGINALDTETSNATAVTPYPNCTYTPTGSTNPIVSFDTTGTTVDENAGMITIDLTISIASPAATSVDVSVGAASTADMMDYTFTDPTTVTFPANSTLPQTVSIMITDDMDVESTEDLILELGNATNNALIINGTHTITINDDDVPPASKALILTGVFDGPLPGGLPKLLEIYVDIDVTDLSDFAIGSANNGGGTDGIEFTLSGSATAGDFIYVSTDSTNVWNYFGFYPNFITGAMNVNGDDAIELFEMGNAIDVIGEIDMDGTGRGWEYMDGWIYRECETGPETTFIQRDWRVSGRNALDGDSLNSTSNYPFPVGQYGPDQASCLLPLVCGNDPYEPNNSMAESAPFNSRTGWSLLSTRNSYICPAGDEDWYEFTATSSNMVIVLSNLAANYDLELRSSTGLVASSSNAGTTDERLRPLSFLIAVGNTYFVKVSSASGEFSADRPYTLSINQSMANPSPGATKDPVTTPYYPVTPSPNPNPGSTKPAFDYVGFRAMSNNLMVYPNPVDNVLTIRSGAQIVEGTTYTVFNTLGQAVMVGNLIDVIQSLDVQALNTGTYIIRIENGELSTFKKFTKVD